MFDHRQVTEKATAGVRVSDPKVLRPPPRVPTGKVDIVCAGTHSDNVPFCPHLHSELTYFTTCNNTLDELELSTRLTRSQFRESSQVISPACGRDWGGGGQIRMRRDHI